MSDAWTDRLCPCDCHWHPHGPYAWTRCVCRNSCPESSVWDDRARAHEMGRCCPHSRASHEADGIYCDQCQSCTGWAHHDGVYGITDKGKAVIASGLTVRQAHEIEKGCSVDDPCERCRLDAGLI
jgi:hypothetical protein